MGILNSTLTASALLSLAGGWSAEADAQQVAVPIKIERAAPDVTGLENSQISHLGQTDRQLGTSPSAVMLGIAGIHAQKAGLSRRADTIAVDKDVVADAMSPGSPRSTTFRTSNDRNDKAKIPVSLPSRTSHLGLLGTVNRHPIVTASVVFAAARSPGSQADQGNSLSFMPATRKTRTQ
jgi:hypothetical protein